MTLKLDEPSIPESIQQEIDQLERVLDQTNNLYDEILDWYESELKSYDNTADPLDELFNPGTGIIVEGISSSAILEALSQLQTFNEIRVEKPR